MKFWIIISILCGLCLIFGEIEAYGQDICPRTYIQARVSTNGLIYPLQEDGCDSLGNCDTRSGGSPVWCIGKAADASLPTAPSSTRHPQDFKDMPAYQPKPFRPLHFLYAIHEKPRRTAIIWGIGGGALVALLMPKQPHCSHYPAGENGVNVPCPKEYGK